MAKPCAFKAEIRQMLDLVIHSLYSKKEIFLRELISNGSDAIDRAKYLALTDKTIAPEAPEWKITLRADATAHTLTVEDNGLGMSAEEMEEALGTIAKSGSKAFAEALKAGEETNIPELIGKFGVGFYAAFMVADTVTVESLRRGENQKPARWMSAGDGEYTMDEGTRTVPGTAITLHLRDDQTQFAEEWTLRDLVRRYSDFIAYPVYLEVEGKEKKDEARKPLNTMVALWKRPKSDVKPEEYEAFYRQTLRGVGEPLKVLHIAAEGTLEYRALLFIPGILPGVAGSLVWAQGIFGANENGLVNALIKLFVPSYANVNFFGSSNALAILSFIMFSFPWIGSYLIFYGAITGVPSSMYEAAKLDGCGWWKRIVSLDLPMILPQIKYIFITSFIASIQNYSTIYVVLGADGPIYTPALLMYREVMRANYGTASAMSLFLFLFLAVATYFNFRMQSDKTV